MANGSLRRQACNQSGPAGSFPTRNRSLPNATAGHQISKVVRRSRWRERPAEEGPSNLGRRPTAHLEEVESPKRWPIQSTMMTALTLITLTFAVVLAVAIVFLLAQIVPQLADLMMMPPPLSGTH